MIKRIPEITAERENLRRVRLSPNMHTLRRNPVEPVPVGTIVAKVFRVTGYDSDCDGSLMARLESVGADGDPTGWEPVNLGLYPDTTWVLDDPAELDRLVG